MRPFTRPAAAISVCAALLLLAMAASATAAHLVTSRQIKNGTIVAKDVRKNALGTLRIANNSLTGTDIRNGSLGLADLSTAARAALRGGSGPAGATGSSGPAGPAGPAGPKGDPGVSGYRLISTGSADVPVGVTHTETAVCPAGTEPLAGGVEWPGRLLKSVPFVDTVGGSGWAAVGTNDTAGPVRMVVRALCARIG